MLNVLTVALVSVPVLTFAWAFGGMRGDVLRMVMPAATILGALGLLLPQKRHDETRSHAYARALGGLLRDPLLYIFLLFAVYLALPLFNVTGNVATPPPRGRWFPFCVVAIEHAGMLFWFVPALLAAIGVRHALTRTGKRTFYEVLVWNSALLSVLGFAQIIGRAQFPYWTEIEGHIHFFSTFGYPNMAGSFFTLSYALSLGLWVNRMREVEDVPLIPKEGEKAITHPFIHAHYPVVAVALNLAAVLATLSRAAMVLTFLLTGFFALYIVARMFGTTGSERVRKFRSALVAGLSLLAFIGVVWTYAPPEIGRELKTLNMFSLSDRVSGKGQYHTRIASAIMRDYPLFGVGGWGYRHFSPVYLGEKDRSQLQTTGGANVHNDYLQFLAELGVVGFGLIVACVCLLLAPTVRVWKGMAQAAMNAQWRSFGSSAVILFIVAPPVLWGSLGLLAVLVHAFGDCPFRSAAVLSAFLTVIPAIAGFLPLGQKKSHRTEA